MSGGIDVIHRRGAEDAKNAENPEGFRRKSGLFSRFHFPCESLGTLRLCAQCIRPPVGRPAP